MALADLAPHLGISSQRPEEEHGVGPDALWALGNHTYAVIEARAGAQGDTIFKKDINQLRLGELVPDSIWGRRGDHPPSWCTERPR